MTLRKNFHNFHLFALGKRGMFFFWSIAVKKSSPCCWCMIYEHNYMKTNCWSEVESVKFSSSFSENHFHQQQKRAREVRRSQWKIFSFQLNKRDPLSSSYTSPLNEPRLEKNIKFVFIAIFNSYLLSFLSFTLIKSSFS